MGQSYKSTASLDDLRVTVRGLALYFFRTTPTGADPTARPPRLVHTWRHARISFTTRP